MRLLIAFVLIAGIGKGQNSILWKITGKGVKDASYLYGTIHFPNKKYFYVNLKVHDIKKKVDAGVFEIELRQDSLMFISMAMMAKPGSRISDIYSEKEQEKIFSFYKEKVGLEKLIANNFTPVALMTTMIQLMAPSDTSGAIDQLFQMDFKMMGKPVIALETIKMQADLLLNIPLEVQKKELLEAVNKQDSLIQSMHELDSVYMNQDLAGIGKMLNDMDAQDYYLGKELLNDNRNLKMVEKIPGMMEKQSLLICVGAAHLGGETGLIELLRKKGYKVEPVLN